jgi:hypothetical protein
MFVVNGNNLQLAGDLVNRLVGFVIDAGIERPKSRVFKRTDLKAWARERRGDLVSAAKSGATLQAPPRGQMRIAAANVRGRSLTIAGLLGQDEAAAAGQVDRSTANPRPLWI